MSKSFPPLLFAVCFLLIFSGCSLPKIIIVKDPLTPEEHINLGVAYEKQGDFENAAKEYEAASKNLPRAYYYLGNVYFQKKDWGKAEKYYRESIRKDPQNADAYNNLAWLYYTRQENLSRAEELARRAIELNPANDKLYRDTLEKILEAKGSGR